MSSVCLVRKFKKDSIRLQLGAVLEAQIMRSGFQTDPDEEDLDQYDNKASDASHVHWDTFVCICDTFWYCSPALHIAVYTDYTRG